MCEHVTVFIWEKRKTFCLREICFCCVSPIYSWQSEKHKKQNKNGFYVLPSAGFMTASWRTVAKLPATPETKDTSNSDTIVVEFAD